MAAQPGKRSFEEDENENLFDFCVVLVIKKGSSSKTKTRFMSLPITARKRDLVDRVLALDEGSFAECETTETTWSSFLYAGTSVSGPWISVEGGCKIGSLHTDFNFKFLKLEITCELPVSTEPSTMMDKDVKDEYICKRWLE